MAGSAECSFRTALPRPGLQRKANGLRGKVAGNFRLFLSDKPDGMIKPSRIIDDLYVEAHQASQSIMGMLVRKILSCIGFDCSNISIIIKT